MAPQVTFQYLLLLGYLWATGFPGPTLWAFSLLSPTGAALPGKLACRDQGASLARENHLEGDLHAAVLRGHSGSVLKKDGGTILHAREFETGLWPQPHAGQTTFIPSFGPTEPAWTPGENEVSIPAPNVISWLLGQSPGHRAPGSWR